MIIEFLVIPAGPTPSTVMPSALEVSDGSVEAQASCALRSVCDVSDVFWGMKPPRDTGGGPIIEG